MTVYIALDDTDMPGTTGTGRLSREIAQVLGRDHQIFGITRHQLFQHPLVPMTSHNSCAVIHLEDEEVSLPEVFEVAKTLILEKMAEGSDPGLAVADRSQVNGNAGKFGLAAKSTLVTRAQACALAREMGVLIAGLGGTCDGVIGAMAGIGLAASGNDGRFIQKGALRQLSGEQKISYLHSCGVDRVMTPAKVRVTEGTVQIQKFPRPALVQGEAVLFVEARGDAWVDLKIG
jgi:hypothetical protein